MTDEERINDLSAKWKLRNGQPGFKANAQALEAEIARLEGNPFTFRDFTTGQFVSTAYALSHPDTTRKVEF